MSFSLQNCDHCKLEIFYKEKPKKKKVVFTFFHNSCFIKLKFSTLQILEKFIFVNYEYTYILVYTKFQWKGAVANMIAGEVLLAEKCRNYKIILVWEHKTVSIHGSARIAVNIRVSKVK